MSTESKGRGVDTAQIQGIDSVAESDDIGSDVSSDRVAFLSPFSSEEDKAIRRKVDWRFTLADWAYVHHKERKWLNSNAEVWDVNVK